MGKAQSLLLQTHRAVLLAQQLPAAGLHAAAVPRRSHAHALKLHIQPVSAEAQRGDGLREAAEIVVAEEKIRRSNGLRDTGLINRVKSIFICNYIGCDCSNSECSRVLVDKALLQEAKEANSLL